MEILILLRNFLFYCFPFIIRQVEMERKLSSFFYSLQLLHACNTMPKLYWAVYFIALTQTFFMLGIEDTPILFALSKKLVHLQSILSEGGTFAYTTTMFGFQLLSGVVLAFLTRRSSISKKSTVQTFAKFLFWVSLLNYTVNIGVVNGFQQTQYKIISIVLCLVSFVYNLLLFNFTLSSKRIWAVNQMLAIDMMRLVCMLVNGSRVLIVIVMVVFLIICVGIAFLRPVYLLSSQNKSAQVITSLSIMLSIFILTRICTQNYISANVALQIFLSLISLYLIREVIVRCLTYRLRQLYSNQTKKPVNKQNQNLYTVEHFLFLHYLQHNYEDCQNQIKLYMLEHFTNCADIYKCKCKVTVHAILPKSQVPITHSKQHQNAKSSKPDSIFQSSAQSDKKQSSLVKPLFSQFVLFLITDYLQNQLKLSQNSSNLIQGLTKTLPISSKRQTIKNSLILQYIKLQKLSSTTLSITQAYLQLKSLEFTLKKYKLLSPVEAGILNSLKQIIIEQKQIIMRTDSTHTNQFCIKYFSFQKVTNKLEQLIVEAVSQIKLFWTEVKMREPDSSKLLAILQQFNKFHTSIMRIYERILNGQQKQSSEIKMMFMLYGKVLQLEEQHKFFTGHLERDEKQNDFKNAASFNLKMYSEDSNTHVMSFSIEEQTFGNLKYTSCGVSTLIDPDFKKISDFLPAEFESFHRSQIVNFLSTDQNFYKHSLEDVCFMKVSPGMISPMFLQVHLMAFLSLGEIEMMAFIKPLVEDKRIQINGEWEIDENQNECRMVACCDKNGKVINETQEFELARSRMFVEQDIEDVLTLQMIAKLQQRSPLKIQLQDSNYELILIKKLPTDLKNHEKSLQTPSCLYLIEFIDTMQQNVQETPVYQARTRKTKKTVVMSSGTYQSNIKKPKTNFQVKQVLLKSIENEVNDGQKIDSIRQKINKIWRIASRPQKNKFMLKAFIFVAFFSVLFCSFMVVTTVVVKQKKLQFSDYSSVLDQFIKMETSMASSITSLRQLNIKMYTGVAQRLDRIPDILDGVDQMASLIHDSMLSLGSYMTAIWEYVDVQNSKEKVLKFDKAYSIISNYYLNSVTNVIQNQRIDTKTLSFSPVQSEITLPYSQPALNYLRFIHNGFRIVPELISLRQNTLNDIFLTEIRKIRTKPFFYIPLTGFITCIVLFGYFIYKNLKLTSLAAESLTLFHKLKANFAEKKIIEIDRNQTNLIKNQFASTPNISLNKDIAWTKLNNIFKKQSSHTLKSFIIDNLDTENAKKLTELKPIASNYQRSSIALNVVSTSRNENTDRELCNKGPGASPRTSRISACPELINDYIQEQVQCKALTKKPDELIEFGGPPIINVTCCDKARFWFIAVPLLVYFTHIFFLALEFNQFMQSVLMMKNQILNRESLITLLSSYNYELGLYEESAHIAEHMTISIQNCYKAQQSITSFEKGVDSSIFGKMQNYRIAMDTFMHKSICDSLELLGHPHPSLNIDYNKQQCQSLLDGILTKGFKQSYPYFLLNMITLNYDYSKSQFTTSQARLAYLKESRIVANAKLYPYIYLVAKHISQAFAKDIKKFLDTYDFFITLDSPIMMGFCFTWIIYFLVVRKFQANRELTIIQSCFLIIGNRSLLEDRSLVKQEDNKDDGERFYFLE